MIEQIRGPVLVIVAHPDDVEAHCAGTVARLVERGEAVAYVLVTSGNRGTHDPAIGAEAIAARREAEQLAAARTVGVGRVRFLRARTSWRGLLLRTTARFQSQSASSISSRTGAAPTERTGAASASRCPGHGAVREDAGEARWLLQRVRGRGKATP
ncbi:MAG: PIG-L family deacetylase [Chloroflexota bacterium]|nr:PIG-L family deacetylase [Chloroflexota bacterium]